MTTPASYDEKTTPAMVFAGVKWPVPELAPRQLRHIRRALIDFNGRIRVALDESRKKAAGQGDGAIKISFEDTLRDVFLTLTDDEYTELLLDPIYYALTRAHPKMERDEFLDMPIDDQEVIQAWFVVRGQSGLFAKVAAKESDEGEAKATETKS